MRDVGRLPLALRRRRVGGERGARKACGASRLQRGAIQSVGKLLLRQTARAPDAETRGIDRIVDDVERGGYACVCVNDNDPSQAKRTMSAAEYDAAASPAGWNSV